MEWNELRALKTTSLTEAYDYFEKLGIEPLLSGQTLLGAVREKDFIEGSHSVDISCRAELITPERFKDIKKHKYNGQSVGEKPFRVMTFDYGLDTNRNMIVELLPKYLIKDKRCLNISDDKYLCWPREQYDVYSEIEFLGKVWRAPKDPTTYLETYYGPTWNVPDSGFHWLQSKALVIGEP